MDASNDQPGPKAGLLAKFLIKIAGVDEQALRLCPPHDWDAVRAVAWLMIATWLYQAALLSIVSHRLFATPGQIRPELILASMFIATFILLIDSYMVMRSGFHLSGVEELKRGGLDISGGSAAKIKASIFLTIRILLSVGFAQLTAIFLSILIFSADINSRIQDAYLRVNAHLFSDATDLIDANIKRATDAVTVESARVASLSVQATTVRQNEIDPSTSDPQIQAAQEETTALVARKAKADDDVRAAETFESHEVGGIKGGQSSGVVGDGPRHKATLEDLANARRHAQEVANQLDAARARFAALRKQLSSSSEATKQKSQDQLPTFEADLATENARLDSLKDQLARLEAGREDAIRAAVENAPNHVALDDGLLAQITALEHIAQEDSKIAAVILLIDLTSFGFELAAVLAKVTSFVPTTYAALLARDAYMRAVRIANEMVSELNRSPNQKDSAPEFPSTKSFSNDNSLGGPPIFMAGSCEGPDDPPPEPPKRPRGRPKKSLN